MILYNETKCRVLEMWAGRLEVTREDESDERKETQSLGRRRIYIVELSWELNNCPEVKPLA